jgi:hypothetical protein
VGILEESYFSKITGSQHPMSTYDLRIARVQRTLRWFEEDIPLLNLRVRELSKERQESARKFAAAMIDHTRAELERLLQERPVQERAIRERATDAGQPACEPAD